LNEDTKIKARIILDKRKNRKDNLMIVLTILIFILTAYLAIHEFMKKSANITSTVPTHENTVVDNKRVYDLQESCSKHAQIFFDYFVTDPQAKQTDEFSSHFNRKLNKCFVLVKHGIIDVKKDIYTENLYDAIEKKPYGSLAWKSQDSKKYWEVKPLICEMRDQYCKSRAEFDAFVRSYMEE